MIIIPTVPFIKIHLFFYIFEEVPDGVFMSEPNSIVLFI